MMAETTMAYESACADLTEIHERLGRYELIKELSRSEWGSLWAARSHGDGAQDVLVRRIERGPNLDQQQFDLVCEAAWLSIELRHPTVASVLDVVITPDVLGIVCDYAGPMTLDQVLSGARQRGISVAPEVALHVAVEVLEGLAAAHELWAELGDSAEPFYGGLEPSSILIDASGHVKLADLGVGGCLASPRWTAPNSEHSQYRAPERRRSGARIDARADIFSVGVLLWELLANRKLSPAMLQAPPRALTRSLPEALAEVVARALEPEPRARYSSALEMSQAIRSAGAISRASAPQLAAVMRSASEPPRPSGVHSRRPPSSERPSIRALSEPLLPPISERPPLVARSEPRLPAIPAIPKLPAVPLVDEEPELEPLSALEPPSVTAVEAESRPTISNEVTRRFNTRSRSPWRIAAAAAVLLLGAAALYAFGPLGLETPSARAQPPTPAVKTPLAPKPQRSELPVENATAPAAIAQTEGEQEIEKTASAAGEKAPRFLKKPISYRPDPRRYRPSGL
jgi:serine/threonine protein kinase